MNKLIKGAVTGAAGIALLLGGAGSFAAWNDQAKIAPGNITTGTLSIAATAGATPTWTDLTTNTTLATAQLASYVFAPGDTLELKENVTISVQGNNLQGQLSATGPTQTDSTTATGKAAGVFKVTTSFDTAASDITTTNGATIANTGTSTSPVYTVSAGTNGQVGTITLPVIVDINLPATALNATENAAVNLTSIGVDLTQSGPGAATATPVPAPTS